ncbi:MAG TPA: hypothetical protein EYO09_01390, partial [Candidatus Poseidoniales archaeon]|nr:hypothetical protein [Candidatus Poseidoniales archaeon]
MVRLTTGGNRSILPFFIIILMLVGDVSALARPSSPADASSPASTASMTPTEQISPASLILVEGIPPPV